jgi:hypothetical protein
MIRVCTIGVVLTMLFPTEPRLVFQAVSRIQPSFVDGVPSWRDTMEVRRGRLVLRQVAERNLDYNLSASLQMKRGLLAIRLIDVPWGGSTLSFKGASTSIAYEARITGLRPGPCRVEVWRARPGLSDTVLLKRAVLIP